MCPVPETQTCMRAGSCPWEGHRLTREREKWPRLGGSWKEPGGPLVGAFSRDELPTLAAGCASDSRSKDPLGEEVKEGSVFILWVLGCYQRFLMRNYVSIIVLEKTLESPLDCKEIKQVNPKGNQSWIFIGRTDAETEIPILWPPDTKSWLIRKDPVAGKDWRQEEKGTTEDEMVGWHHRLYEHEFEQGLGDGGQGNLVCCSPWGCKESDTTEWLNNNNRVS